MRQAKIYGLLRYKFEFSFQDCRSVNRAIPGTKCRGKLLPFFPFYSCNVFKKLYYAQQ